MAVARYLTSYTNNTFTPLPTAVGAYSTRAGAHQLFMCNTSSGAITVNARIVDHNGAHCMTLVKDMVLPAGESYTSAAFITLNSGESVEVKASAAGVEFAAFGETSA